MKTLLDIAKKAVLPLLAVVGVTYAIYYSVWAQSSVPVDGGVTPVSTPGSDASNASSTILAGLGIVEPAGGQVDVAPPEPGVVEWVIGKDRVNTLVKKGEELLRLDGKKLQAELEVRKAQVASAEAELNELKSKPRAEDLTPLAAKVAEMETAVNRSKSEYDRAVQATIGATDELRVQRAFAYRTAQAQWNWAKAEYAKVKAGAWAPEVKVAEAGVISAKAQVEQTKIELDRLIVRCTSDLTLLSVDVDPQEYVGTPPGETIIMLGDTKNLHLRVYIDEDIASRFQPGAKATARLPYGAEVLKFPLLYVRHEPVIVPKPTLTGEQTERVDVRVLQVLYRFENQSDQPKVLVGQQLDVYIDER